MARSALLWAGAVMLLLSTSERAGANVETSSGYTKVQTYNAALRYLRVDLSYEVTEKDADAAYLLFQFMTDGRKKPTNGAIEIVEREEGVRVFVRLPDLPHYQEQMLSDGLFRKLRDEYGEPPRHDHHDDPPPRDREKDKKKSADSPDAGG